VSIAGLILAGGKGTRIGGGKALLPFRGAPLIAAVIARVQPQVAALALNPPEDQRASFAARFALPLIGDALPGYAGPLSGILAGLDGLAEGAAWLASFPCDTPFLPRDLVARLAAARCGTRPVVIRSGEEIQALCALWPRAGRPALRAGLESGALQSARRALAALDAVYLDIPARDPAFFNINTPEDLAAAERMDAGDRALNTGESA
jgi:molybdenum cofactor guanylyltransferase